MILSGGNFNRTVRRYAAFTDAVNATSDLGGITTSASIRNGYSFSNDRFLQTSFSLDSTASNDALRISDVYHFQGTASDAFVLQLGATTIASNSLLVWLNFDGEWVEAVDDNTWENATAAMRNFQGSYADFQNAYPYHAPDQYLGAYGVDAETQTVWAVLNNSGQFAVIPEPSIAALCLLGAASILLARRRRTDETETRAR